MDSFIWRDRALPRIALGTVQLGLPYGIANTRGQPDFKLACEIVGAAWESGIRCFDTAQAYGQSESILGRALAALDIAEEAQVITKLGLGLKSKSADEIVSSIEQSRLLLGVPKLFAVMLHRGSWLTDWQEKYAPALRMLRENGVTSFVGVSVYTEEEINLAFELPGIDIIQVPFNAFDQRGIRMKWFERAHLLGKLIFVRSLYLQGLLLLPLDRLPREMEFARRPLERFHALCQDYRLSPAALAMAYAAEKSAGTVLLFGAETPDQVRENISLYGKLSFPQAAFEQIDSCFADLDPHLTDPSQWPVLGCS